MEVDSSMSLVAPLERPSLEVLIWVSSDVASSLSHVRIHTHAYVSVSMHS